MILGALIGLGIDKEQLFQQLQLLNIPDFALEANCVDRSGIAAVHVKVITPAEHAHRHLRDIEKIIQASRVGDSVKERAISIFNRLAEAEAKVHGIDIEKVHFHEVGAMDTIVDVVGACIGFEMLGVEKFVCSKIHVGSGFVDIAHGRFPVPPPAVAELLTGVPIYSTDVAGELITPTGAAIIATVCNSYGAIPPMAVERTAYGAGTKNFEGLPNALRLMLGETSSAAQGLQTDRLCLIETNIDDLSPQILGYVMERAFELGALDCWFTPIQMKKNRPAQMATILCDSGKRGVFVDLLLKETSTLGVRVNEVERQCLPREFVIVKTEFGDVDVKIARYGDIKKAQPEYEHLKAAAQKGNITLQEMREIVLGMLKSQ